MNNSSSHSSPKKTIISPDDGEKLMRRWGHPFLIKIDELNGGSKQFAVGSEKLLPGDSIHVHRHNDFEEILIITAGKGRVLLGDKYFDVKTESLIFIPQQTWHGLDNIGTENMELLWIFPKLGMEKYFRATSIPVEQQTTPLTDVELNRIRDDYRDLVEYRDSNLTHYTSQKIS